MSDKNFINNDVKSGQVKGTLKENDVAEAKKIKKKDETGILKLNALGPVWKYDLQVKSILIIILLIIWIFMLKILYSKLTLSSGNKIKNEHLSFLPFFIIIGGYPIIFFLKELYNNFINKSNNSLFEIDPYWPICIETADNLPKDILKKGVIGRLDYKCLQKQLEYNNAQSKMLQDRAYTATYSVFLLMVFFVTSDAGRFKGTIERDNKFVTTTIQYALAIALFLMTSIIFKNYYYMSTYILDFLTKGLQLLGALLVMLVTHIIYRIIYLFI